ncbi:MAG: hypothetical protein M3509_11560 [Chloroflexota bacterium]|nr:hypothetical protein [Chloroflexota bacterium]
MRTPPLVNFVALGDVVGGHRDRGQEPAAVVAPEVAWRPGVFPRGDRYPVCSEPIGGQHRSLDVARAARATV